MFSNFNLLEDFSEKSFISTKILSKLLKLEMETKDMIKAPKKAFNLWLSLHFVCYFNRN